MPSRSFWSWRGLHAAFGQVAPTITYEPYSFTTIAGLGPGAIDGNGSNARFSQPGAVAVDGAGNVYVADTGNHTIRRITPAGDVTTVAGQAGRAGFANGNGTNVLFNQPAGIAVDTAGNLYVADRGNHVIRRITPAADVTTLAGAATVPGSANGTGGTAQFNSPSSVAIETAGSLVVADTGNHTIRRVTTGGSVTTYAGSPGLIGTTNGTGAAARFNSPSGVTVDASGVIFIGDTGNHIIRRMNVVSGTGVTSTLSGGPGTPGNTDGINTAARFNRPAGVVASAGFVYVADSGNHTVRRIDASGSANAQTTTFAGLAGSAGAADGSGAAARFSTPLGVAIGPSSQLFVADTANSTIRRISSAGAVTTIAGLASAGSADGNGAAARFLQPAGMAVNSAGEIFLADRANHTIRKVTADGEVTTVAGVAGGSGSNDSAAAPARFNLPGAVALDSAGNIYVADTGNHTIRRITPAGAVTTLAGSGRQSWARELDRWAGAI